MGIQVSTTGMTAGNLTRYEAQYMDAALGERTYDQLAQPNNRTFEPNGSTIQRAWIADLVPRPTTAVGSETADFDPQTARDVSGSFTLDYIADGLKAHDLVRLKSSLSPEKQFPKLIGKLAMETIDAKARREATEANLVLYGGSTQVSARVTLDLGTAAHCFGASNFTLARSILGSLGNGDPLMVIIDNFQYADLIAASGSIVLARAEYADSEKVLYNYEFGQLMGVRIIVSPHAKTFYAAGAANVAPVATTLASAATAGATTISVTANTNMAAGMWLTIGTAQTAAESDATLITEAVKIASISTTTITITGGGPAGGLKYDHAISAAVSNADTAHCAVFGSKNSLTVAFQEFGRYGKMVAPFEDGNAKQWTTWSFKYFGGYHTFDQSKLLRCETSASIQ